MNHDDYWKSVWQKAHERLDALFAECSTKVADITGDDNGIDSVYDAKCVLAHAMRCADSYEERACAIIAATEIVHAMNELNEGTRESVSARASALVK